MKKLAAVALVALAGCATQPEVPLEVLVQQVSVMHLCEGVYMAPEHVASAARQEAQRRGVNCADYLQAIMAQRQAQAAAASRAVIIPPMQYNVPAYQMPAPPRPVNCNSYRLGNSVQTNCY